MRLLLFLLMAGPAFAAAPDPGSVAIVFNRAVPESAKLAETYRAARDVPVENLVGLDLPVSDDISRSDYESKLLKPLRDEFTKRSWWRLGKNPENLVLPVQNKIRYVVVMRGVPLRIRNTSANPPPIDTTKPFNGRDEASVDSELAVFGIQGLPTLGVVNNAYYKSEKSIAEANMPFLVLVGRIDAASWSTCERMIRDAIATEKTGLWGRGYVDIANKVRDGDQWMENVAAANVAAGIPTVVDQFNDTFPTNYPMTDGSLYYGWYEGNVNGPFLNPAFRFKAGAVAMHLHSFSAEQIRDPNRNWSAALLERGACCTVGNTYEPYLGLTHDFGILHKRLLAGATFGEAAYAAIPALSWQSVAFGDPLYRPFLHLDGTGEKNPEDNDYRALRLAALQWGDQPDEQDAQLQKAADRTRSGILAEAVALRLRARNRNDEAKVWFSNAKGCYVIAGDKLRQDLGRVAIDRLIGRKDIAAMTLREMRTLYGPIPEASAISAWLTILDPAPPPPADPTKAPLRK